jgi:hypothetical protein
MLKVAAKKKSEARKQAPVKIAPIAKHSQRYCRERRWQVPVVPVPVLTYGASGTNVSTGTELQ